MARQGEVVFFGLMPFRYFGAILGWLLLLVVAPRIGRLLKFVAPDKPHSGWYTAVAAGRATFNDNTTLDNGRTPLVRASHGLSRAVRARRRSVARRRAPEL